MVTRIREAPSQALMPGVYVVMVEGLGERSGGKGGEGKRRAETCVEEMDSSAAVIEMDRRWALKRSHVSF